MNFRDLKYLVALAELQHFGRAAERCHVSQPTLSLQVRKIEEQLGLPLFERNGRRVLLTSAGEQVVSRARAALREFDEMHAIAQRLHDPAAGSYRLGAFPTLAPYLLPRIVPTLHERYPRMRLLLLEEKTSELLERLRAGGLDLALLALPAGGEDLHEDFLFEEDFRLAVAPGHALARRKRVRAGDVKGQALLLLDEGHCLRDQALDFCSRSGIEENREFRATSLETLKQMVATDLGITLVPALASAENGGRLRFINFQAPAPSRRIGLVWRRGASQHEFFCEIAAEIRTLVADAAQLR